MCWVSAEATQKVAEKDFYVYKIGQVLKDGTFVSHYKYFKYVPKTRNKTISLYCGICSCLKGCFGISFAVTCNVKAV